MHQSHSNKIMYDLPHQQNQACRSHSQNVTTWLVVLSWVVLSWVGMQL